MECKQVETSIHSSPGSWLPFLSPASERKKLCVLTHQPCRILTRAGFVLREGCLFLPSE